MANGKRPNILFLMSDEHRADAAGFAGNTIVRTPVLDELARTGVVFNNAYTPSPICVPSRQCLASGQLPKTCGCEGWIDLPSGHMTFARRFAQHAYETACFGKLHHQGPDQMQGWNIRFAGDVQQNEKNIADRDEASFSSLKHTFASQKWSDAKEILRAGVGIGPSHRLDDLSIAGVEMFLNDYHFGNPYYDRQRVGKPLLLKVSLLRPHYPYFTTEEKLTYYLNRVQPFVDQNVFDHPFLSQRQVKPGVDVTMRDMQRVTAAYYGMIETIDEQYGSVMRMLEHHGEDLDDWIIVYTSDHGEMLGEHGIWEKQKFFEASARVPLIIRWPRQFEPRVVEENVNLCDLFATLCELAGIAVPPGLDSRSMVPLMRGDGTQWRQRYHDETISQFAARNVMIKRGDLKYQWYGTEMPEVLFDLNADPGETRNHIDDAKHSSALATFRARLAELGHGPNAATNYVNAGYCDV